jgi:hypothetical protein
VGINAAPTPGGQPIEVFDAAVEDVFGQVNSAVIAALGITAIQPTRVHHR